MLLSELQIVNFRNIEKMQLSPVDGVNLIFGENASGKTSILEAIHYLSHIRSFRTSSINNIISQDKPYIQLVASISNENDEPSPLGIRRSRQKLQIRLNQQTIKKVSEVAHQFPVLTIHPESYLLISGGPKKRREYLDWGVFHVEHGFLSHWQRFKKALQQRNSALKSRLDDKSCSLWNHEIIKTSTSIDYLRQNYFSQLQTYFKKLVKIFFIEDDLEFIYKRGWDDGQNLADLFERNLYKDKIKGYTAIGPHRADLIINFNGRSSQIGLSRGQQKTLVALMRLAQAMHFTDSSNKSCILLYDDLQAELDKENQQKVLQVLSKMNIQLFLTCIENNQIDLSAWQSKKMFHVEHGKLKDLI